MEIENFSVRELTVEEQLQINGGGRLADYFAGVWDTIKDIAKWIWDHFKITIEFEIGDNVNFDISSIRPSE